MTNTDINITKPARIAQTHSKDETPLKKTDIFALLILFTMIVVMLIIPVITCLPFIALII